MASTLSSCNILLTSDHVKHIFASLNLSHIVIHDLSIYQKAFIHQSFVEHQCKLGAFSSSSSYEVLEFLGDSVLEMITAHYLMKRFPQASQDRLTQLKIGLVRSGTLAQLAKYLNFHRYILIAEPIEFLSNTDIKVGRFNDAILEDVFESFLEALFIDQGGIEGSNSLKICNEFIAALFEKNVDFDKLVRTDQDPKGTFYAYCQLRSWQKPRLVNLVHLQSSGEKDKEQAVALYMNAVDCEHVLDSFVQKMILRNASKFTPIEGTEDDSMKPMEVLVALEPFHGGHRKKLAIQNCYTKALQRFQSTAPHAGRPQARG
ncbi:MAG: ribonuclease III family protein, partial [Sphingobacteriaceae bacterium]